MPKFGVYYVPPEGGDFYILGSSILGFDVRKQECLTIPQNIETELGGFNQEWTTEARPYGFHLTIGDAIDCDAQDFERVETELSQILACFDTENHKFLLTQRAEKSLVSMWGNEQIVVLRYGANEYLKMFHDLVTARVNPIGKGSVYTSEYDDNPEKYADSPYKGQRVRMFYSPNVLSSYTPHFTLLNPYTGGDPNRVKQCLNTEFEDFQKIRIRSICLVVQHCEGQNFEIHQEFMY